MKKKIIINLMFWTVVLAVHAQLNCSFTHYSSEEGLSQNTVTSIMQDHNGFMWFATWNGIDKFDGYTFKTYKSNSEISDNLSHNRVDFIAEDVYGYIWVLTYDNRAHRFNPTTETFEHIASNDALVSLNITSINILSKASVWLTTEKEGVIHITTDSISHQLTTTYYSNKSDFIPARQVNTIYEDNEGNEWLLGQNGIGKIKSNSTPLISYFVNIKEKPISFYAACENAFYIFFSSKNGIIWCYNKSNQEYKQLQLPTKSNIIDIHFIDNQNLIAASENDGFFIYDIVDQHITSYNSDLYNGFWDAPIKSMYVDKSNEVWFMQETIGEIIHFNPTTKRLKKEHPNIEPTTAFRGSPAFHIHEDVNGITWVHPYGGGFSYFDRELNKLIPFYNDPKSDNWKFSNKIHSAYSDFQGNLWMSTHSKELEKISFHHSQFTLQTIESTINNNFNYEVRSLFEDSDHLLWAGFKDGKLRIFDEDQNYLGYLTTNGRIAKQGISIKGGVYTIIQDKEKNIWIGTKGDGIIKATKQNDNCYKLTRYTYQADDLYSLSDNNVYDIYQDDKGRIWVATFGGGINYISSSSEGSKPKFINYRNKIKDYPINNCYRARSITSDSSGRLWIGTTMGILTFDGNFGKPENIRFEHYVHNSNNNNSLCGSDVFSMLVTHNENIYFATFGGGLNKLIPSSKPGHFKFEHYLQTNDNASDILLSLEEDHHGNIWYSTENGITKFTPSNQSFENYNKHNFNFSTRFIEASSFKKRNGILLFGTSDGILSFNPDSVRLNKYIPSLFFTRLFIRNEDVTGKKYNFLENINSENPHLVFTHKEKIFSIQYAALDLSAPSNIRYAYKLEGLDDNWSYVEGHRMATFTNVPKGKYIFKVKSTNSDGIWVDNVLALPITVMPSFWETPLAYVSYFLFVVFVILITVYILFTIFRLKHKITIEHELSDLKLKFFTNISHELRTPLTLINCSIENIVERQDLPQEASNQLQIAQKNTNRMLRLVNQILDFRKLQNNRMKLQLSKLEIVQFIRKIMSSFESMAEEHQINFIFETESKAVYLWLDEDKLEKILFNLISNAFKYTPEKKTIKIFLREEDKSCIIGVQDQGIGFLEEKRENVFMRFENSLSKNLFNYKSTGIGLAVVKELLDMHKANIELETEINVGSTFVMTFYKGKSYYNDDVEYLLSDSKESELMPEDILEDVSCVDLPESDNYDNKEIMLIVEDNSELQLLIKSLFKDKYNVIQAVNGIDGYEKANKYVPDIIISDIVMPKKDGIEMIKELRTNLSTSHIPIVILSAKSTTNDKLVGFGYGVDAYISKPFSSKFLKARIKNILEQRKKLQQIYCSTLFTTQNNLTNSKSDASERPTKDIIIQQNNISSKDAKFIDNLIAFMKENMNNSELVVDDLAQELAVSRSVFFKKLKALTGLSPIEFIREIRIKYAAKLIEKNEYFITEISEMVGINDSRYFSKCFKRVFNMTPSAYKEHILHKNNQNIHIE